MKIFSLLLWVACCIFPAYGGYADGLISAGEYEELVDWISGTLIVDGGGANTILAWNSSRVEVRSTTPFLGQPHPSGITDLVLWHDSRLDYYGGETEELVVKMNATAHLYGGRIDGITSSQYTQYDPTKHIFIYAQEDWSWKYENDKIRGITGLWYDGTPFNISFETRWEPEYGPAWKNIEVITPEPATLLLMALGGLLSRRQR